MRTSPLCTRRPARFLPAFVLEVSLVAGIVGAVLGDRVVARIERAQFTGASMTESERALAAWLGWITAKPFDQELPETIQSPLPQPEYQLSPPLLEQRVDSECPRSPESSQQPDLTGL